MGKFKKGNQAAKKAPADLKAKPKKKKRKKTPKDETDIVKNPYTFTNVIDVIDYCTEREVPTVVLNTIVNEWNRLQQGVITRDEEKTLKLQFAMVLEFVRSKYDYPEFFTFCEEHAPRYLPGQDDARLPLLRD